MRTHFPRSDAKPLARLLPVLVTVICLLAVASSATGAPNARRPANKSKPTVSGKLLVNETLTASAGNWSGGPTGFAYQWQRCDATGSSCADVALATTSAYTLTTPYVGSTMRVVVTAFNSAGTAKASSAPTGVVGTGVPPSAPVNSSPPSTSGSATVGGTLLASPGTWSGSPSTYGYQWRTCDAAGANCSDVAGRTSNTYVVQSSDVARTLRVAMAATNSAGTGGAVSAPTAVVTIPPPTGGAACTTVVTTTAALDSASRAANPGDVVCINGTLTTSSNIFLSRSGTRAAPIVYRGGRIQYTGGSASGGMLQVNGGTPWAGAHDIVFDGITFDGGDLIGSGIFVMRGAHHITVQNCVIQNTGSAGIVFSAVDYVTAVGNRIYRAGYNQGWAAGITLWYGGNGGNVYGGTTAWYGDSKADLGFHNIIARNIISGTYDNSIDHSDGNGFLVDGSGDIPPALFVGNVAFQNGGRGFVNLGNTGSVWFVNNTSYMNGLDLAVGSGQAPEMMAQNATDTHWVNNIAYGRKNTSPYATAYLYTNFASTISWARQFAFNGQNMNVPSSVTADANQYRYVDPRFRDQPLISALAPPWTNALPPGSLGNRLALADGSPAIDAGVDPLGASGLNASTRTTLGRYLDVDLLGNPRYSGAGIDVGAFER